MLRITAKFNLHASALIISLAMGWPAPILRAGAQASFLVVPQVALPLTAAATAPPVTAAAPSPPPLPARPQATAQQPPESTPPLDPQRVVPAKDYAILIMGTIISKTKQDVALIKELDSKKVIAVRVGDNLLGKYQILAIKQDHLTIKDQTKTVVLLKNKFAGSALAATRPSAQAAASQLSFREDGMHRITRGDEIDIKITGAYRDNIIHNDLQKILMEAAATPHTKNNRIVGFTLSEITPGSIFEKAGFTNGDLIQSINSTPLNSPSTAIKILHSIKQDQSVDVELLRDGTAMTLSISVN